MKDDFYFISLGALIGMILMYVIIYLYTRRVRVSSEELKEIKEQNKMITVDNPLHIEEITRLQKENTELSDEVNLYKGRWAISRGIERAMTYQRDELKVKLESSVIIPKELSKEDLELICTGGCGVGSLVTWHYYIYKHFKNKGK